MFRRLARLFVIRTRFEAWAIIYGLAMGATTRGWDYVEAYPGYGGYLLFLASTGAVFMGGAKILDAVPPKRRCATGAQDKQIGPLAAEPLRPASMAQAVEQKVCVERLFDKMPGSQLDGARPKILLAVTGHNDNRPGPAPFVQQGQELQAAHARHAHVHENASRCKVRQRGHELQPASEHTVRDAIRVQQEAD